MRPLIGINCEIDQIEGKGSKATLDQRYVIAIERAGGIPVLLSPLQDPQEAAAIVARLDGLVLSGGDDLDPMLFGEDKVHPACTLLPKVKERFDVELARAAVARAIPTLGICYGMQLLAVIHGGKLHQHIPDALKDADEHRKVDHPVKIESGSRLRELVGRENIPVRSSHHQAVSVAPQGWKVTALAQDGVIEAIEAPGKGFLLGVQWHPERDPQTPALFDALVRACAATRRP